MFLGYLGFVEGNVCKSECPYTKWFYRGKEQAGCSNPDGDSRGPWCPTKAGIHNLHYVSVGSSGYEFCRCGICEADCPYKKWFYRGEEQEGCSNPDGDSRGPWCPTKAGMNNLHYVSVGSSGYKFCNCKLSRDDCDRNDDCPSDHFCISSGKLFKDDYCVHKDQLPDYWKVLAAIQGVTREVDIPYTNINFGQFGETIGDAFGSYSDDIGDGVVDAAEEVGSFFSGLFGRRRKRFAMSTYTGE
eukprot:GFUD01120044.1.p1 GENE.GFUD01120044.1~~GFUD01120044.1.p1  ORF type:complete len:261 (+),score=43.74 GFUD01120044.1:57-785(+)